MFWRSCEPVPCSCFIGMLWVLCAKKTQRFSGTTARQRDCAGNQQWKLFLFGLFVRSNACEAKRINIFFALHCVFFVFHQTTQQINFVVSFFFSTRTIEQTEKKRFDFHDALVNFAASKCVDRSKMTAFYKSEMAATTKFKKIIIKKNYLSKYNNNKKKKNISSLFFRRLQFPFHFFSFILVHWNHFQDYILFAIIFKAADIK